MVRIVADRITIETLLKTQVKSSFAETKINPLRENAYESCIDPTRLIPRWQGQTQPWVKYAREFIPATMFAYMHEAYRMLSKLKRRNMTCRDMPWRGGSSLDTDEKSVFIDKLLFSSWGWEAWCWPGEGGCGIGLGVRLERGTWSGGVGCPLGRREQRPGWARRRWKLWCKP